MYALWKAQGALDIFGDLHATNTLGIQNVQGNSKFFSKIRFPKQGLKYAYKFC
jgi:hypothetical protein